MIEPSIEPPCLTAEGEQLRDETIAAEVKRLLETTDGQCELLVDHDLAGDAAIHRAMAMYFRGSLLYRELRMMFSCKARKIAEESQAQHGIEYWNDLVKEPMEMDDD